MNYTRILTILLVPVALAADLPPFRPPAVPLVTHDPYFSIWSTSDRLADGPTRHWTGTPQEFSSLARIDGKLFRILGADPPRRPPEEQSQTMQQTRLEVWPTRSVYMLEGGGIRLTLTFLSPVLPADLELFSRPASYVTWLAQSIDGNSHAVAIYFDAASTLVVDQPAQPVTWARFRLDGNAVLRMGSRDQPILGKKGDDLRIDWGYLYLAAPPGPAVSHVLADRLLAWDSFRTTGRLPETDDLEVHTPARSRLPVMAVCFDLGRVGAQAVSRHVVVAYDDIFSIEYLERRLRPYWRRNGATAADLLRAALNDYPSLVERCRRFDEELMQDLRRAGGEEYARLSALAYRQTVAAHKLTADIDGTPFLFSKENFSNGCIDTVDVTYPSSPFFLLFNPRLLQAQLQPVLEYASLERWRFPFAPHDLGTYPLANGQVYGGGEKTEDRQMPVEESGNMLIMLAALSRAEGNASFAVKYWPLLAKWAAYLKEKGLDPENQLSTDDFAGHLAHNANLSIKAILALGSYASLCEMAGRKEEAARYHKAAVEFARRWEPMAEDGDHYRLAFDKPGTWSQKYNLVWDRLLGLHLFRPEIARKEYAFYKRQQGPYGLPLDSRELYTKLDWILWTATLAESKEDFEALARPAYRFANETADRVPLSDWYWTHDARHRGFQARSVVGGVYIKMLEQKWLHAESRP